MSNEGGAPRLVLRVGKRKTSWESRDVDEIVQTEFKQRDGVIDVRPSVYVLENNVADVVRVVAEHSASFLNDPPKGSSNLDLEGLVEPVQNAGQSKFTFANSRHHEIPLDGVDALRTLIGAALPNVAERLHTVSRDELLDYAAAHCAANDPEWQEALSDRKEWLRLIAKRQAQIR